jgi:glycosyltransferase involved in cell wall biosynthesis
VHHPTFVQRRLLRRYNMIRTQTVLDRSSVLAELYRGLCYVVSGNTVKGFKRNLTLPNAEFLRSVIEEAYGVRGEVFYPAVLPDTRPAGLRSWEERQFLVVSLGRIAPDKGTLHLMELFAALHHRHHDLRFAVIGRVGDRGYAESVFRRGEELNLPLEFVTNASNVEVKSFLSRAKFFLHAKEFEHFGVALIEAADYGCLPFAHDSGGVPEILLSSLLRYRTTADLLEHFDRLNSNNAEREEVLAELVGGLDRFRLSAFAASLDRLLAPFLDSPGAVRAV